MNVAPKISSRALLGILSLAAGAASADLTVTGLEGDLRARVLSAISLDRELCTSPAWRINSLIQRAAPEARSVLEAHGYYSSIVQSNLVFGPDCWNAELAVQIGDPVQLRRLELQIVGDGEIDPDLASVINDSVLAPGRQLNHGEYESVKTRLFEVAQRKGYAEARLLENRIDVYPDESAADVLLRFEPGPRYAFGAISVRQDILNPRLVEGFFDIEPGQAFDRAELADVYAAFVDSGYFSLVDVRPGAPDAELEQIPVEIELTPGNRKVLSYGGGFATDTGPRVRIARTNRRVNRSGAQLNLNTELSPVVSEFIASYRFPFGDPRLEWVSFDTGIKRENTDTADSDSLEFGARRVTKRSRDWQETQFLDLLIEDFEIAGINDRRTLLQPGISWFLLRADNAIRPDRGYRLFVELSAASDDWGSDTSFVQATAATRWVRSFGSGARFLARLRAGVTNERDFDELPPSVRFFAGGDNSIRGYEFRSQGPVDANGEVVGGNRLIVGSIEYEYPVKDQWSIATFYDAGNAFRDGDFNPVAGAGIGARWQSPLGPIRFDIAKPLNGLDRDVRIHLSLGPDL